MPQLPPLEIVDAWSQGQLRAYATHDLYTPTEGELKAKAAPKNG